MTTVGTLFLERHPTFSRSILSLPAMLNEFQRTEESSSFSHLAFGRLIISSISRFCSISTSFPPSVGCSITNGSENSRGKLTAHDLEHSTDSLSERPTSSSSPISV